MMEHVALMEHVRSELFAPNFLAWFAQVALLVCVACGLPSVLGVRSPRARLAFWHVTLVVVLVLPFVQPWQSESVSKAAAMTIAAVEASGPTASAPFDVGRLIVWITVAGIAFRLAWLGLGLVSLAGYRRAARPIDLPNPVCDHMTSLGVEAQFGESAHVSAPVTFGMRRPTVLVPASFASLPESAQAAALTHELIHIARRDWLVVLGEEIVRAALWFHPAVWLLLGRIAAVREQVVDRFAVSLTGDRRAYLDALYRIARSLVPAHASLAVPFVQRNHLLTRIRLLNQEHIMSRSRLMLSSLALATILIGTTALSTFSFPLVRTAEAGEILFVGGDVKPPKRIEGPAPSYPDGARKDRVTGQVVLQTVIVQSGKVRDISVLASPDDRLSAAAVEAVRDWVFEPATLLNDPVDVYYNLTINFRLDAEDEEAG